MAPTMTSVDTRNVATALARTPANIGLTVRAHKTVVEALNTLLADEYVLYTKTRNYHWNVTGPLFNDLHKFFEAQYTVLDEKIDAIAEFVRYTGEKVPASLQAFQGRTRLAEDAEPSNAAQMVRNLLADHQQVIVTLRKEIEAVDEAGAVDVADFLTGLLEEHEKMAWMLRAMAE